MLAVCGPEPLTGASIAATWSDVLDRKVSYSGDDLDAFETAVGKFMPSWAAYDMRTMVRAFQKRGMYAAEGTVARLERTLGHPLRTYHAFARETAAAWT